MDTFVFLKFLSQLALPPASLAVGVLVGLVLLALRWRRLGRLAIALAIAETIVLSFPPVSDALMAVLENQARAAAANAPPASVDDWIKSRRVDAPDWVLEAIRYPPEKWLLLIRCVVFDGLKTRPTFVLRVTFTGLYIGRTTNYVTENH